MEPYPDPQPELGPFPPVEYIADVVSEISRHIRRYIENPAEERKHPALAERELEHWERRALTTERQAPPEVRSQVQRVRVFVGDLRQLYIRWAEAKARRPEDARSRPSPRPSRCSGSRRWPSSRSAAPRSARHLPRP
jgi:hypothetical protein